MEKITIEHIDHFRKILHVKPGDSAKKIDINFENASVKFHPSVRPIPKFITHFDNMVVAREFLKYKIVHKDLDNAQIVDNWNEYEREKVSDLLSFYKSMSKEEFEKAIEVKFAALNVMKIFIYVFLGLSTAIGVFLIIYLFVNGSNGMGALMTLLMVVVSVAFAFKGPKSPKFWGRKF